jgi:flagellar hook-associated protein 2
MDNIDTAIGKINAQLIVAGFTNVFASKSGDKLQFTTTGTNTTAQFRGDGLANLGFTDVRSGTTSAPDIKTIMRMNGVSVSDLPEAGETLFTINGADVKYIEGMTIQQLTNEVSRLTAANLTFNDFTRTFTLTSKVSGEHSNLDIDDGDMKFLVMLGMDWASVDPKKNAKGSDAVIILDGVQVTSQSNVVRANGMDFTLTEAAVGQTFNFNMQSNVEPLMDVIRNFVDEYNKLVGTLHLTHMTSRPRSGRYSFFEPLTDEQRRNLTESEVRIWEEQAKTGLLHRDRTVREIHSMLRTWITRPVPMSDGTSLSLAEIGVRPTRNSHRDGGMLEIDETQLRRFIEENGHKVTELFTQRPIPSTPRNGNRNDRLSEGGISERLSDIIHWATASTERGPMSLYARAGWADMPYNNAELTRAIEAQDRRLDDMRRVLERRENQFFAMFSRMEVAMMQQQQQMNSLFGMMGGMFQQ